MAALMSWIHGCGATTPEPLAPGVAHDPPREECEVAAEMELVLAELTTKAAAGYGSFSPFLYEAGSEGPVRFAARAVEVDPVSAERARELLKQVNGRGAARELLRNNVVRSQRTCEDCPREQSSRMREQSSLVDPERSELQLVTYALEGAPGAAEQAAFLLLMQPGSSACPAVAQARFEGPTLMLRQGRWCAIRDCHPQANDGDLGWGCCSPMVVTGVWTREESDPRDPRHCCQGTRRPQ